MKARAVSLGLVALLVLGGVATIVIPRIKDDSSSTSAYCKTLVAQQSAVGEILASGDPTALVTHLALFQSLAANAPPDISGSWAVLNSAIGILSTAIRASGHQPSDFVGGTFPAGLTPTQTQAIKAAASTLTSPITVTSSNAIDQEVRDVCQLNLGM